MANFELICTFNQVMQALVGVKYVEILARNLGKLLATCVGFSLTLTLAASTLTLSVNNMPAWTLSHC